MITIPTISQLRAQIQADLEASYGSSIPTFGKNYLRVQSLVQASKMWVIYKSIGFLQKNIAPDTADSELFGGALERYGRLKLGRNPFTAVAGNYTVEVTGTVGATISAKTVFKSDDDSMNPGKSFIIDNDFQLASSPDTITLRALEAGLDSKLEIGDTLTATIPIAGVNKSAEVTVEEIQPLAAEDIEQYRAKVLEAYQLEPQGGSAADYRIWASDAQGVKTVYPYATSGQSNEIDVFVEATIADSTDSKGTPTPAILSDVEDVIEFDPDTTKNLEDRGRRPLGVFQINVQAVSVSDVDIQITGLVGSTPDMQTLITDSITELINSIRPFVSGADVPEDKNDILDTNKIIAAIISAVPGAVFTSVQLTVDAVVLTTHTFEGGEIPYPNSVTFV